VARYLITGGAGFIGSHLCDRLIEQGHDCVIVDDFSSGRFSNLVGAAGASTILRKHLVAGLGPDVIGRQSGAIMSTMHVVTAEPVCTPSIENS